MTVFLDGLKEYFEKHKFKNTTVADFISAMQSQISPDSTINLTEFAEKWLHTKGLNRFTLNNNMDTTNEMPFGEELKLKQGYMENADYILKE